MFSLIYNEISNHKANVTIRGVKRQKARGNLMRIQNTHKYLMHAQTLNTKPMQLGHSKWIISYKGYFKSQETYIRTEMLNGSLLVLCMSQNLVDDNMPQPISPKLIVETHDSDTLNGELAHGDYTLLACSTFDNHNRNHNHNKY